MGNKIPIYFRAEGNSKIGLGHIYRSLALAEYLMDEFNLYFVYSKSDIGVIDLIPAYIKKIEIPFFSDYISEAEYILHNILCGKEIMVMDGYNFKTEYQLKIKDKGTKTVYIDDIHNFKIVADAVINHAGGLNKEDFDTDIFTRLYLGPEYAILRKSFIEAANKEKPEPNAHQVFISFGGADPDNNTLKILKEIGKHKYMYDIIIGSAYLYEKKLNEYIEKQNINAKVYKNIDAELMKQLMQKSAKAITSASTVSYEYLACSLGTLYIVKTAENQNYIYNSLINSNQAFELDKFLIENYCIKKNIFTNIKGNVIKIFTDLRLELKLNFRLAKKNDIDVYFSWANDSDVRKQSFNSDLILYGDHIVWFNKMIIDKNIIPLIFEIDSIPVAQVRIKFSDDKALINYSVDKFYRGKGVAKAVIKICARFIFNNYPQISIIEALVKKDNYASYKVFVDNNFKFTIDSEKYIFTLSSIQHK